MWTEVEVALFTIILIILPPPDVSIWLIPLPFRQSQTSSAWDKKKTTHKHNNIPHFSLASVSWHPLKALLITESTL